MLNVKLKGHEYRYEVFQIVSLFYNKADILFAEEAVMPLLISGVDECDCTVYCKIMTPADEPIFFAEKLDISSKKEMKNAIKRTVLMGLSNYANISIPWGILVGIRPTKLVHELRAEGLSDEDISEKLINYYKVSDKKSKLTIEVATNEASYIKKSQRDIGFYVGIPFCPSRCSYCSFTSNSIEVSGGLVQDYINALYYEIEEMLKFLTINGFNINTLYFGGGTPTSLSEKELALIFDTVMKYVNVNELREFTVEAGRPDSITEKKLKLIKSVGASRISINPQTMNDETLNKIGRKHTVGDVLDKFYKARELGFDNINMDLIVGLPGEGLEQINNTLRIIKELSPDNITVHTMAIKRASRLNEYEYKNLNTEIEIMYDRVMETIRAMGLYPYYMYRQKNMVSPLENIGYCKSGKEGIYNIQMIAENISIAAMGADSVTKVVFHDENRIEREANVKDVKEYIGRIEEMVSKKIHLFQTLIK